MTSAIRALTISRFFLFLYFGIAIQPLFFVALGFSLAEILWLESILLLCTIVFEVPTGLLGDLLGRKTSLVLGNLAILASWIPWLLGSSLTDFAIAHVLVGLGLAFTSGSDQALIYDDLARHGRANQMQRVMGQYSALPLLATAIAGLVGGFFAPNLDLPEFYQLFQLTVIAQIIALVILLFVPEPPRSAHGRGLAHTAELALTQFRSSVRLLKTNRALLRLTLLSAFTMPFSVLLYRLFPPFFQDLGGSAAWLGGAVAIASMVAMVAKLSAHRLEARFGTERTTLMVTILPAFLWIALALAGGPLVAVGLFVLTDAAGNLRDPIFADYLNRHIPSQSRATVLSLIALVVSIYAMIMRPLLATIGDYSLTLAFVVTGAVLLGGALIFRVTGDQIPARMSRSR
ncbi:MFS transporter [Candidatus Berkelbacteria bacterium]|nr:MFS transporter [Candidatus Berkelbacteria bacterium]